MSNLNLLGRLIEVLRQVKDANEITLAVYEAFRLQEFVFDSFAIALVEPGNSVLTFPVHVRSGVGGESNLGREAAEHIIRSGLPLYVPDVSIAPRDVRKIIINELDVSSFIGLPLTSGGHVL